MERISIPYVSIKPNYSTIYSVVEGSCSYQIPDNHAEPLNPDEIHTPFQRPKNNSTSWTLSEKSRKKLMSSINWLTVYSQKKKVFHADKQNSFSFKVNFITLTLPCLQRHKDTTIKSRVLNGFLTELRDRYHVKNYVWRAECQKNGSIHFHIVTDSFINAFLLRRLWNKKLELLGYITQYQKKWSGLSFKEYEFLQGEKGGRSSTENLQAWEYGNKTKWSNPNTTDVHSVYKVKDLAAYISKYMAKKAYEKTDSTFRSLQNRRLSGRLWGCSTSISRLKSCVDFYSGKLREAIDKAIDSNKFHVIREKYFTCVCVPIKELIALNKDFMSNFLVEFAKHCNYSPQAPPPKGYHFDKSLYYDIPIS